MNELISKRFDQPDETVSLPNFSGNIVILGETYVGKHVFQPGWRWSKDVKPVVGTASCQFHHVGVALSGRMHVIMDGGAEHTISSGDAFDIPPGHDASIVGDEPFVTIEFRGGADFARPSISGERVLATLLLTDIVSSTEIAARLGDAAWKKLLSRHFERVRLELDRFRGHEITTTGDGFLAMFDGTARAVACAASICRTARQDGIEVRAGVHSGEVERHLDNLRGVAVHVATRIAALAGPGEVLISDSTFALIEGSGLSFSDAGEHELKGVPRPRKLYRLVEKHQGKE